MSVVLYINTVYIDVNILRFKSKNELVCYKIYFVVKFIKQRTIELYYYLIHT